MSSINDEYQSPLSLRYASPQMKKLFSPRERANTWRKLWLWLAEAEQEVGLKQAGDKTKDAIGEEVLEAIRANLHVTDEAFKVIAVEEKRRRHDVMSHVHALEQDAPAAAGKIHVGATSCYVTDNADLIFMREALDLILPKLAKVVQNLRRFAMEWKDLPTLGYTHYQAAQPITMGKRACQWIQELMMDLKAIERARDDLQFRGAQGTTGTQASFMELFQGDTAKIDKLNELLCKKAGFSSCYDISTQTYTRKVDKTIANALSSFADTAIRFSGDIRHMSHDKLLDEPHEKDQIGSSAMAYKSNPMRSERIGSLGRKLSTLSSNFAQTYQNQWLERTLDDSAIRRIDIPEMFLLSDAILIAMDNVTNGLVVFPKMVEAQLAQELPFMATENIIMKLVSHGVSRQDAHEQIRLRSQEAVHTVRVEGKPNDLIQRIKQSEFFKPIWNEVDETLDGKLYIGRSVEIVERYAGPGGKVEEQLKAYEEHIRSAKTAELAI